MKKKNMKKTAAMLAALLCGGFFAITGLTSPQAIGTPVSDSELAGMYGGESDCIGAANTDCSGCAGFVIAGGSDVCSNHVSSYTGNKTCCSTTCGGNSVNCNHS